MKSYCKKWIFFAGILLLVTGADACHSASAPVAAANSGSQPAIRTATVQTQKIEDLLEVPAKLQPDPARVIRVFPPAGGRLLKVDVRPGDRVSKGQELAVMESSDVSGARADYSKARSETEKTERSLQRAKLLYEHQAISQREYEQAQADAAESKSDYERAEDRLRVMGVPLQGGSYSQVRLLAPRAAVVLDLGAAPGELSKSLDNANPICTLADLSTIWVVGDVYEKDLAEVQPGQSVEIALPAYPQMVLHGKVAALSDALDPATRTAKIRIVLDNPKHLLKPEMFATIRVHRHAADAIVVPSAAVLHQGGDNAVMVQTKPGSYERRLVTVRGGGPAQMIVVSGLKTGETIVVDGAALLRGEEQ